MPSREILQPPKLALLKGSEHFTGIDATVHEFWAWGFGDLRMNIVRGVLAEFLIAKALGLDTGSSVRAAWDNHDIEFEGVTIEVKSAARWQSFLARGPSKLVFSGLRRRKLDETLMRRRPDPEVSAQVYVFAAHHCDAPEHYKPLSTEQWSFYVLPGYVVRKKLGNSVSVGSLERIESARQEITHLKEAVRRAAVREREHAGDGL